MKLTRRLFLKKTGLVAGAAVAGNAIADAQKTRAINIASVEPEEFVKPNDLIDAINKEMETFTATLRINKDFHLDDPCQLNDKQSGYETGAQWINSATNEVFVCVDSTCGAAVWVHV